MACLMHRNSDDRDTCILGGKETICKTFKCYQTIAMPCSSEHEHRVNGKECARSLMCGKFPKSPFNTLKIYCLIQVVIRNAMVVWLWMDRKFAIGLSACRSTAEMLNEAKLQKLAQRLISPTSEITTFQWVTTQWLFKWIKLKDRQRQLDPDLDKKKLKKLRKLWLWIVETTPPIVKLFSIWHRKLRIVLEIDQSLESFSRENARKKNKTLCCRIKNCYSL